MKTPSCRLLCYFVASFVIFRFGASLKPSRNFDQWWADTYRFQRNGVLAMLERDMVTKPCPQRWQDLQVKQLQELDVVLCLDDRIFEVVLEDVQLRGATGSPEGPGNELTTVWRPLHLLCLDTKDTPEHAKVGGSLALELCQAVGGDWYIPARLVD